MKDEKKENVVEELPVNANEKTEDLHGENLGDRVRVLSPGMMVAKRFFRSKLSIIGLLMLVILFVASFVGPIFSKWSSNGKPVRDETSIPTATPYKIEYTIDLFIRQFYYQTGG